MKITEEMVKALTDVPTQCGTYGLSDDEAMAMILAVAPLIVEECARVVLENQAKRLTKHSGSPWWDSVRIDDGVAMAAAIRALTKEPAQAEEKP